MSRETQVALLIEKNSKSLWDNKIELQAKASELKRILIRAVSLYY